MDLLTFVGVFPEFAMQPPAVVQSALDAAAEEVSAEVFGGSYDRAHGLFAASLLAVSPPGQPGRVVPGKGANTYHAQFDRILKRVTCGRRTDLG